jgi:integrase
MKIHLRKRKLTGKSHSKAGYSLYLDIYYKKGNRKREFLGIYIDPNDTKTDKEEKTKLAENLKAKRLIELLNEEKGIPTRLNLQMDFIEYYKGLMAKRIPSTRVTWESALNYAIKYSKNQPRISDINKQWLDGYVTFLLKNVSPLSATTYLAKIKSALHEAERDGIIPVNPSLRTKPIRVPESVKDFLTIDEIQRIGDTEVRYRYLIVKKAFLFSCFTGLRFSDLLSLRWSQIKEVDVNGNGKMLAIHKMQRKTGVVNYIPLNESAISIMGIRPPNDCLVFNIDFSKMHIRVVLNKLLEAAKIDKKITFHSARRTYATMLLANGANIMTVKELLGHKDISSTLVYAKVMDSSKLTAVNNLPKFHTYSIE